MSSQTFRLLLWTVIVNCAYSVGAVQYSLKTVASFTGDNGGIPVGRLISDSGGNLYGTTQQGTNNSGTIFEVAVGSNNVITLGTFNGINGSQPAAGLIFDSAGGLVGTTTQGGFNYRQGTVFQWSSLTHQISVVAEFDGTHGGISSEPVIADASGNLFGTTDAGGTFNQGTIFKVAAGSHTVTTMVSFTNTNGSGPASSLYMDSLGNLFGTTGNGGTNNVGVVFELPFGATQTTTLVTFNGTNGAGGTSGLTADADGNLYGVTVAGGPQNNGVVYKLAAGTHTFSILATFGGTGVFAPEGDLAIDASGNLFGISRHGPTGAQSNNDFGTVFEVAAGTHAISAIATFNGTNGAYPAGGLIVDTRGNIFGTTQHGGPDNYGTIFELSPVPEPSTAMLLMLGYTVALTVSRRSREF